jgi:hypothetical protein
MASILVHAYDHGKTATAPLANVWIYWKIGTTVTTLRTDSTGLLCSLKGTDATKSWLYTETFDVAKGLAVSVAFTRGAKPLHPGHLSVDHYTAMVLGDPWPEEFATPADSTLERWIPIGWQSAIGSFITVDILIPNHYTSLQSPSELTLWPLLFEHIGRRPNSEDYYTVDLPEKGALFQSAGTNKWKVRAAVAEWAPAAPAPERHQPYERALNVLGSAEARATRLQILFLDPEGHIIPCDDPPEVFREDSTTGNTAFSVDLYLSAAEAHFGDIQILVSSLDCDPPFSDAYSVALVGAQPALLSENDEDSQTELRTIDFAHSPHPTGAAVIEEGRMRRLHHYWIDRSDRAYSATDPTIVETPRMPLWMAELQLLGYNESRLAALLEFRKHLLPKNPNSLTIECQWNLELAWDGPCAESGEDRSFRSRDSFNRGNQQKFTLSLADDGSVTTLITPTPVPIPFPIPDRPLPTAKLKGEKRGWGRLAGSSPQDALIFEWQPRLVDSADHEIIRGGYGELRLDSLKVAGANVPVGLDWDPDTDNTTLPPATPVMILPTFRVSGLNPTGSLDPIIDCAVEEYWNTHPGEPRVLALPMAMWQVTMRRLFHHESKGVHYGTLNLAIVDLVGSPPFYGKPDGLPLFGPPHGYGIGQLDNPPVTADACWSFRENIRFAVDLVMGAKASDAYALLGPTDDTDAWRARYQRDCVRRYNGWAPEFVWSGGAWKIKPSVPVQNRPAGKYVAGVLQPGTAYVDSRVYYPNDVLGTNITYYTGNGLSADDYIFVGSPIPFTEANWGPTE